MNLDLGHLRQIFSAALASDCLDHLGYRNQVLASDIEMISGEGVMMGYTFPVKLEVVDVAPEVAYVGLLAALGFKVFGVETSPLDINSRYEVVAHNVPCSIDGVTINPGDLIVADVDGVTVIPAESIDEVVRRVEEKNLGEGEFRKAVREGMSPSAAFAKFGVL